MEYATASKDIEDFRQAVDDWERGKGLLPDSQFALTVGMRILTNAVLFARQSEENALATKWQQRGDEDCLAIE